MTDELDQPTRVDLDLSTVLAALADPGRLATVRALGRAGEAYCGQISHESGLGFSKSTLSHHLRVLREAGITRTRVVGTRRLVSLRRADLDERFPGLLDVILCEAAAQPAARAGMSSRVEPVAPR